MKSITIRWATAILFVAVIVGLLAKVPVVAQTAKEFVVRLQDVTPGVQQTGHANLSGKLVAGQLQGDGIGVTNVNAAKLGGLTPHDFLSAIGPWTLGSSSNTPTVTVTAPASGAEAIKAIGTSEMGPAVSVIGSASAFQGHTLYAESSGVTCDAIRGIAKGSGASFGVAGYNHGGGTAGVLGESTNGGDGVVGATNSSGYWGGRFLGGKGLYASKFAVNEFIPAANTVVHITHEQAGVGHTTNTTWPVRIESEFVSTYQGGIRITDEGFLEITNNARSNPANFARLSSTGVWTAVSDQRAKKNIEPLRDVLQRALQLRPVSFKYKNGNGGTQVGLVAQDVAPLFPSLVEKGSATWSLNYSGLGVVAIAALQELKGEIDTASAYQKGEIVKLRAENEDLRVKLLVLAERLASLERRVK